MYERTKVLPKALKDKPVIPWYLRDYFLGFLDLHRRREFFMAEQPLQLTEIDVYCRRFKFEEDDEFFFFLMCELDAEYMKFLSEKREQEKEHSRSRPRARSNR